jgi:hypothetical protein
MKAALLHLFKGHLPWTLELQRKPAKETDASCVWWLMTVILATQEADIRKIRFKASLGKKFLSSPSQPIKKLDMVVCACHPRFSGTINRKIPVQAGPDPVSKITQSRKG